MAPRKSAETIEQPTKLHILPDHRRPVPRPNQVPGRGNYRIRQQADLGPSDAPGNAEAAHGPERNVGERLDGQVRRSSCGFGLVAGAPRFPDSVQFWTRRHAKPEPRAHPRDRRYPSW